MNIIKGIDRIALVIAISIGIIVFFGMTHEFKKPKEAWEHFVWEKEYDERYEYLEQQYTGTKYETDVDMFGRKRRNTTNEYYNYLQNISNDEILKNIEQREPKKYKDISYLKAGLLGLGFGLVSFIAVLLLICLPTRGIKWLGIWIVNGFKNKDSPK